MTRRLGRLDLTVAGNQLTLSGRIDDTSPIGELVDALPHGEVVIDTGGVTFVNSIGMRELIRLVRGLRARGVVVFERVADVLMIQLNMMAELGSSVQIRSFHAQYACPACGAEAAPLVDTATHAAALSQLKAPAMPCPDCGAAMELADFAERYLSVFRGR